MSLNLGNKLIKKLLVYLLNVLQAEECLPDIKSLSFLQYIWCTACFGAREREKE